MSKPKRSPRQPASPASVRARLRRFIWNGTAESNGRGVSTRWLRSRFGAWDRPTVDLVLPELEAAGEATSEWVQPHGQAGRRWHPGPNAIQDPP